MTCKDCIHYTSHRHFDPLLDEVYTDEDVEYLCPEFKDKSRFVELPCAIGSDVFVIENCTCYTSYYKDYCECRRRTAATKYIKAITIPTNHCTKCVKLFVRPFKTEYLHKVGKTVFLTIEEAENKLEEMKR